MDTRFTRTHPVIVVAATAVILTCLLAIGVMTGIVPSPMTRNTTQDLTSAPPASTPKDAPRAAQSSARDHSAARSTEHRAPDRAPVGMTESTSPSRSLAGSGPAPAPACYDCGTVSSVRTVTQQGEASMIGPAAGGLLGGVLGHQVGNGRGQTVATIAGAAVGAAAGTEVERRHKSTTSYVVAVRMNDGTVRNFNYASAPGVQTGEKVRVVDGKLVRD